MNKVISIFEFKRILANLLSLDCEGTENYRKYYFDCDESIMNVALAWFGEGKTLERVFNVFTFRGYTLDQVAEAYMKQ